MTQTLLLAAEARRLLAPVVADPLDDDRAAHLAAVVQWSCLVEPGDRIAGRLVAALGAAEALHEITGRGGNATAREAAGISSREWSEARARWLPRLDAGIAREALLAAARSAVQLVVPDDPQWPRGFRDLGDHAPLCVWVRGDIGALTSVEPAVAVVGARAATSYGEHVAMELAADLVARGVGIVSGAAYGIDGMAHRAALNARGRTIALLAGGCDRAYPAGHSDLLERIAAAGAVVSEVPCGAAPTKWRFLQRNRLIAALGDATVVVEAGWRSGSLNTAGHAAALSRPLGAVPGAITSAASAGCHRLLREFDARCITGADDVMELLGLGAPEALFTVESQGAGADRESRSDEVTRVLDAMSVRSARPTVDIARRSGLSPADVGAVLGLLELSGAATRQADGWRRAPVAR